MDKREIKITADGSHTLFVEALNETYHSIHGAIQESNHVFIEGGLNYCAKIEINILEIGFGTGLNAFLTLLEAQKHNIQVNYTSLEVFPLEPDIIQQLNYTEELKTTKEEADLFHLLHQVEWEGCQGITKQFNLTKIKVELANFYPSQQFDVIYFDAFGPDVQPEMWTTKIFEQMYHALFVGGILVTYCAKGIVKRSLKEVGFTVKNLLGPPGKREMTRAKKV